MTAPRTSTPNAPSSATSATARPKATYSNAPIRVEPVGRGPATPTRFRFLSILTVASVALAGLAAAIAAFTVTTSTDRARENSGPVLVAVQDVRASLAEADSAATAVFLSGVDEDRSQRRLYETAIERASQQVEEVARLIGDEPEAHASLKRVSSQITTYAGLIEASRFANQAGLGGADQLSDALALVGEGINPELESVSVIAADGLEADVESGQLLYVIALAFLGLALLVAIVSQLVLYRRTNRLLNLPILLATVLLAAALVLIVVARTNRTTNLNAADDGGYESIELTADIQATAYQYKTEESLALIAGNPFDSDRRGTLTRALLDRPADPELLNQALRRQPNANGLLVDANRQADSAREVAATVELLARWQRYVDSSEEIRAAAAAGEIDRARALAVGPGNSTFNGFNTAVESVLLDNRAQFSDGVGQARRDLDNLTWLMIALPLLAALLALWGFQQRIAEYR